MNERDPYAVVRRRSFFWPVVLLLIAFLLGIVATALAVRHWSQVGALIHPPAAVVPAPPVAIVPAISPNQAATPDEAELAQRVGALEDRLGRIDHQVAAATGDADRAEGLLVTFAARRALDRGQSLGFIEGMLRERFAVENAAAVAQVIAAAQRPVTLAQLRDGLEALRPTLVAHAPEESVWQGVKRELGNLFVVRHADEPSAIPTDRFARAEHALEQGQADAAAAEVARMPGAARAGDWLAQARRYVMARNALDRLEAAALLAPRAQPDVLPTPSSPNVVR